MAKRKTPTTHLGEIRNPHKAAALMACVPNAFVPVEITRRADGVLCTFFDPTDDFIAYSHAYDRQDIPCAIKRFTKIRRRLLDMKEHGAPPKLPELKDTVLIIE